MCLFLVFYSLLRLPRHLQKHAAKGLLGVCNILKLVTQLIQLLLSHLEWLYNLILCEGCIIKLCGGLVPESVEDGGVGKSVARLSQTLGIDNDVCLGGLFGTLKGRRDGSQNHLLILLAGLLEPLGELGIALLTLLLCLLHHNRLGLAQLTRGDDLSQGHFQKDEGSRIRKGTSWDDPNGLQFFQ